MTQRDSQFYLTGGFTVHVLFECVPVYEVCPNGSFSIDWG